MDDDPTVVKRQRMEALVASTQSEKGKGKRKGKETTHNFPIDTSSFQSVIWKPKSEGGGEIEEEKEQELYPPGEGEKVALLKNWREVFKYANPAIERVRKGRKGGAGKGRNTADIGVGAGSPDMKREDSSDGTSGLELDRLRDNEVEMLDPGDVSVTTPAESSSSRGVVDEREIPRSSVVVEIPVKGDRKGGGRSAVAKTEGAMPNQVSKEKENPKLKPKGRPPAKQNKPKETMPSKETSHPQPQPQAQTKNSVRKRKASVDEDAKEAENKKPRSTRTAKSAGKEEGVTGPVRRSTRQKG